ncbi:S-layer homology domain-containing protein [Proteiniborus sp. MB09-C3]|uniref:S-layer homology domain-containing protein n=1 Tax=Proteiniborus sp. MB09-C3 TaxID=3050072 RepID=UPI0025566D3C|nr:S-layer homology domain-containing protein [Proteiniborus sp. MB09-C3]WIV12253.1 S-layer homology domain-containing protein [Proteiniborus sp. MB09-C3]
MFKKATSFLLVFVIMFSSMAFATDIDKQRQESAEKLIAMGILTGFEDGSLRLEENITREQFATLAVKLLNKESEAEKLKKDSIFKDVKKDRWSVGYINVAVNQGLIVGRGDGTFAPSANITHGEILTILVRLLGYTNTVDPNKKWPQNYVDKAKELGIDIANGIDPSAPAIRGDVVVYIDKSLIVKLNGVSRK